MDTRTRKPRCYPFALAVVLATAIALCALWAPTAHAQANLPEPSPLPIFTGFLNGAPFGIEVDPATGNLHVTDTDLDRVWIHDPITGQLVTSYGHPNIVIVADGGLASKDLDYPADVAFMGDSIYVAHFTPVPETANRINAVVQFDRETLTFVAAFPYPGEEIVGIDAVDGEVFVAVRGGQRVSVLDPSLESERSITFTNTASDPCAPNDVAVHEGQAFIQVLEGSDCGSGIYVQPSGGGATTFVAADDGADGYALAIGAEGLIFQSGAAGFRVIPIEGGEALSVRFEGAAHMTGIGVHPSGRTAWVVERAGSARIFAATMERCAGEKPDGIMYDSSELVLRSAVNDGMPADDGGANRNVSCSADGPCSQVGAGLASTTITQRECNALVDLYESTNGPNWTGDFNQRGDDFDWHAISSGTGPGTTNPCLWAGVNCSKTSVGGVHVTALDLPLRSLAGELPSSIKDLPYLRGVSFHGNALTGEIPSTIGELLDLEELRIGSNELVGTIPQTIGALTRLEVFDASANQLSGPLPSQIATLSSLHHLQLEQNNITGAIPAQIGNLGALTFLDLSDNALAGAIPSEIGNLLSLDQLDFSDNELTGAIPSGIGNLSSLRRLLLSGNALSGPIPSQLANATSLSILSLGRNDLTGELPSWLGAMELDALDLSWNELRGAIPPALGDATTLSFLALEGNPLVGDVPQSLLGLSGLETLTLGDNGCLTATPAVVAWLAIFGVADAVNTGCSTGNWCAGAQVTMWVHAGTPLDGTAGPDVILGTPTADVIDGDWGDDLICGGAGDDTIRGGSGDFRDRVYGGDGDDTIFGGPGIDYLFGEDGADTIDGEGGSDRIRGGDGADMLKGNSGADRMYGGPGDDQMFGMGGQDFMWGQGGNDTMQGNWQTDNIFGGDGDDTIYGAGGKDSLYGEAGNDALFGGTNTDFLDGGPGSGDTANGGKGIDNPVVAPQTRASNGQLFGGSGCVNAETRISC